MADIVLITGANTGIGFQIVRALSSSSKPYHILVGARSPEKAASAIKAVQGEYPSSRSTYAPVIIDIEQDESIQSAYEAITTAHGKLDVLINNAGAQLEPQHIRGEIPTERELWNRSWNLNTASTQVMTSTFTPLLLKSSNPRLLFVTSGTSTLAGIETQQSLRINHAAPPGWPKPAGSTAIRAYRSSKTGLNMLMREWHRILQNDGVKVFGISPGYLATALGGDEEFNKKMGAGDPAVAGPFVRSVLEGERDRDVGKILTRSGIQEW